MQDNQPYIITKKHTVRHVYWGRIIAFVVVVALIVIGVVLWFSRSSGKLVTPAREYWFVSMGEYGDLAEASSRAETVVASGGAGYIYGQTSYKVVAACYADKSDADKVSERLGAGGEHVSVFSVACAEIAVEKPKKNADVLKNMLKRPQELFDALYDISVKTDTKEITETAAKYAVLKMSVKCSDYASESAKIGSVADTYLSVLLTSLALSLDNLAYAQKDFPQSIKYALCEFAVKISDYATDFVRNR